jgi:hypothetical protein
LKRWAAARMSKSTLAVLVAVSCLLIACADGECVPFEGKAFNWHLVSEVESGLPSEQLRSKLGDPVSVTPAAQDAQDWRFFYRCRRTSWVALGPFKIRSGGATMHSEAIIRVKDGHVEKVLKNRGWVYE